MSTKDPIEIVDVAPRDGFQAVKAMIPTAAKIAVTSALMDANFRRLEVGAFVSPRAIPQMADTKQVHAALAAKRQARGMRFSTLIPNALGAKNAMAAGITDLVFVVSASQSHNQSNVKRSIAESLGELEKVVDLASGVDGFQLRVNIATVFDCPYEGRVPDAQVFALIEQITGHDVAVEIGLCDTTGRAFPDHVQELCGEAVARYASNPGVSWAFHGHDTYGLGVANALYAYDAGIRVFDAAAAGLGGCPFAPGASGNTASEDLVFTFENMGISSGVDLEILLDATKIIAGLDGIDGGGHVRNLPRQRVCG
ncbi:MAG: hydroxymethylglutaryl-CoA lyase [Rhodospirillales bacterium]|nr:hydroxymethylglutaryl-CoA lyase [Rhodospirillales bacterium]